MCWGVPQGSTWVLESGHQPIQPALACCRTVLPLRGWFWAVHERTRDVSARIASQEGERMRTWRRSGSQSFRGSFQGQSFGSSFVTLSPSLRLSYTQGLRFAHPIRSRSPTSYDEGPSLARSRSPIDPWRPRLFFFISTFLSVPRTRWSFDDAWDRPVPPLPIDRSSCVSFRSLRTRSIVAFPRCIFFFFVFRWFVSP